MLKEFVSWFRLVWDVGVKTDKNAKDVNALQEQNRDTSETLTLMVAQRQHDREMNEERIQRAEARRVART